MSEIIWFIWFINSSNESKWCFKSSGYKVLWRYRVHSIYLYLVPINLYYLCTYLPTYLYWLKYYKQTRFKPLVVITYTILILYISDMFITRYRNVIIWREQWGRRQDVIGRVGQFYKTCLFDQLGCEYHVIFRNRSR